MADVMTFGGETIYSATQAAAELERNGFDPSAVQRANSFTNPRGCEPGIGYLLMTKGSVEIVREGQHDLILSDTITVKNLLVVEAENLFQSTRDGGDNDLYLVTVADVRWLLQRGDTLSRSYNVRLLTAAPAENYISVSRDGGVTDWTWETMIDDLWSAVVASVDVTVQATLTVPEYLTATITTAPERFICEGQSPWRFLCHVLSTMGLSISYNPLTEAFDIRNSAESDMEYSDLHEEHKIRWTGTTRNQFGYMSGRLPAAIEVLHRPTIYNGSTEEFIEAGLYSTGTYSISAYATLRGLPVENLPYTVGQVLRLHDPYDARLGSSLAADDVATLEGLRDARGIQYYDAITAFDPCTRHYATLLPFVTTNSVERVTWAISSDGDAATTTVTRNQCGYWRNEYAVPEDTGGSGGSGSTLTDCACGNRISQRLGVSHECTAVASAYNVAPVFSFTLPELNQPGAEDLNGAVIILEKSSDEAEPCVWEEADDFAHTLTCDDEGVERTRNVEFYLKLMARTTDGKTLHPAAYIELELDTADAGAENCLYAALAYCPEFDPLKGGLFTWQPGNCLQLAGCFCVYAVDSREPATTNCFTGCDDMLLRVAIPDIVLPAEFSEVSCGGGALEVTNAVGTAAGGVTLVWPDKLPLGDGPIVVGDGCSAPVEGLGVATDIVCDAWFCPADELTAFTQNPGTACRGLLPVDDAATGVCNANVPSRTLGIVAYLLAGTAPGTWKIKVVLLRSEKRYYLSGETCICCQTCLLGVTWTSNDELFMAGTECPHSDEVILYPETANMNGEDVSAHIENTTAQLTTSGVDSSTDIDDDGVPEYQPCTGDAEDDNCGQWEWEACGGCPICVWDEVNELWEIDDATYAFAECYGGAPTCTHLDPPIGTDFSESSECSVTGLAGRWVAVDSAADTSTAPERDGAYDGEIADGVCL